ncbi:MAG TPA: hypothetical protein PKK24_10100, partial [Anaerolineaceae bacterium]|nr:hypothetical protein [Anaerolineaceae bacterium]
TLTNAVLAIGFGASANPDAENKGTVWIDDLGFLGSQAGGQPTTDAENPQPTMAPQQEQPHSGIRRSLPCGGSVALPLGLVIAGLLRRRKFARK